MAREDELKQLIERKATFQRGCRCLAAEFTAETYSQLMPLVTRAHTLLKTRHTNVDFWRSGLQLFRACHQCTLPPDVAARVSSYLAAAQDFLHAADAVEPEASPEDMALPRDPMEFLMALGDGQAHESHFDDAGLIVDDTVRWARAQISGTAPAAASPAPAAAAGTTGTGTGGGAVDGSGAAAEGTAASAAPAANAAAAVSRRELQRQILDGIQAVYDGMAAVTRGTEAIERELDSVLSAIQDRRAAGQPRPVPPMSKRLLDALPVLELTAERLVELGPDSRCAVCTDALQQGDKVFSLPCRGKHWYHPACVRPWLLKTNSCPVCRDELPTDDPHYEANKEKEQEDQKEREGAANALSHNEYMYT